jgi:hypothetical protein
LIGSIDVAAGPPVAAGVTIQVTPDTHVEDQRRDVRPFTFASLGVGHFVEVRGMNRDDACLSGQRVGHQ